jgi:hypothetical protein
LLQDQQFFDAEIYIGTSKTKDKPLRAHRAILQVRCPAILAENGKFAQSSRGKDGRYAIVLNQGALPQVNNTVMSQLLMWVYIGSIEVSRYGIPTLLDVTGTANLLQLNEVVWTCEHRIRESLSAETVHAILKGAEDRKLDSVKQFTLAYAFEHWGTFIGNQEGAKILGLELFQDVSAKYATMTAKGEKLTHPEGPQPPNTIMTDYRRLHDEMPLHDMEIEVGSKKIKCHRAILGTYTDALAQRFHQKLKTGVPGSLKLVDHEPPQQVEVHSAGAIESFLKFVYYGETTMDPIDACEMIHKVNSVYKLTTFQMLCEHTIVNNINAKSVLHILGVTYIKPFDSKAHIQTLRKQAFGFIIANFATTDFAALATMPPEIRTDLILNLQKAFQQNKLGVQEAYTDTHSGEDGEAAVAVDDSGEAN